MAQAAYSVVVVVNIVEVVYDTKVNCSSFWSVICAKHVVLLRVVLYNREQQNEL